jgi:translation initiation factor 1 (eIF-1/SUI1)
VTDIQAYSKSRRSRMVIIAGFEVSDIQRKHIAQALGKEGLADRDTVRAYIQQQGEAALSRLGHPLISAEAH